MDNTYGGNRPWATNNGFITEQQPPNSAGNRSILTTISGQITASQRSGNDINNVTSKQYNPHLIGVQSKFRRKYYHKALLGLLIFLIIILIITIIIISLKHKRSASTCRTNECIRTAANLIYSMDEQTDPCEDFYTFTCGRWANEHPRPDSITSNDWFRESQAKIMRKLRSFLQANVSDTEPTAVAKVKVMYKACINTDLLDDRELEPLVQYLREFELPLLPSGFNVTLSKEAEKKFGDIEKFNWLRALVNIKKFTGMDLIIGFDIFADPLNNTIKRIAFGTPESESSLPFNNDDMHKLLHKVKRKKIFNQDDDDDMESREEEEEESAKHTSAGLTAYVTYVKHILEAYILYLNPDTKSEEIEDTIGDMALKAVKVARRIFRLKEDAENATKPMKNPAEDIVYISVIDLQNQSDKLITPKTLPIWEEYLQLIMNNTKHTKPFNSKDIQIITSQADIIYLQTITEYLFEVSPEDIEFYIWLSVVEELILHTTSDMRLLHTEYMRVMIGTEGSSPRSIYCAHAVNSLMGMAVSYSLADKNFTLKKLPRVENMLKDIRLAFEKLVRSTNWMDAETKRQTLQKSAEMKSFIGFPDWLTNATELNEYYEGVSVNETRHLENMIGVLRWQMQTRLDSFYEPEVFGWATSPSNVNAFHTFQSNAITIPIAILQYPFYDLGLEALNYGSIGTILGHELTHGFDDSGRMFDKNGNMVQWWSNETVNEYVNRTECFIDQYNHYYLSDIGEYIDGELTLGENIADNGGMREAYHAYKIYTKHSGREHLRLPGLERYTHEQLFFIAFGNLWCETYTPAASRYALEDSHCPGKIRLKGVLSNSDEFARAFKCRRGTGMNPIEHKCRIW